MAGQPSNVLQQSAQALLTFQFSLKCTHVVLAQIFTSSPPVIALSNPPFRVTSKLR